MARPWAAGLLRVVVVVVPAVAGAFASWAAARLLPPPSGLGQTVVWLAVLVATAVTVVVVTEHLARRLLPLAWLMTLTLTFPDRAPSRVLTARRAASGRARRKIVDQAEHRGLPTEPAEAAEQALVLVAALGTHDRRTRGHSERVRILADVLASEAGVTEADRDRLRWAALLHDIGKLTVPGEILNKPDRPDDQEWATLRRHPQEGGRLVAPLVAWLGHWAGSVEHHHEHWDGSGYPAGLAGEKISLGGRILAVADAYEVITAARAYKKPLSPAAAREELVAGAGSQFDPLLVRYFLRISLGRLRWATGLSAFLAQVPLLSRLWSPALSRVRQALSGPATAAVVVTGLVVSGVVSTVPEPPGRRSASSRVAAPRGGGSQAAGPATPLPGTPTTVPGMPAPGAAGIGTGTPPSPGSAVGRTPPATVPPRQASPPAPAPERSAGAAGEPVSPGPSPPPVSPAPLVGDDWAFWAKGRILAPGMFGRTGFTESEFRSGCAVPGSQGFDGWVFELPPSVGATESRFRLTGRDAFDTHRFEVGFFSADCRELRRRVAPVEAQREILPAGTRFLVVNERAGVETEVVLVVFATS
jgi:hypothetical protein